MRDLEISKLLNISNRTLSDWKHAPSDNWRAIVYNYFALKTVEEIEPEIDRIKKILHTRAHVEDKNTQKEG